MAVVPSQQPPSHLWDSVLHLTKSAQDKNSDPLLWALQLSSSLNSAVVSLPSVELADLLISYICWANHVLITWKFLEKALTVKIVPPRKRSLEMVEARMRSLTNVELAHLLVSYICWANHVPITWKFLEKALIVKIVPPRKRSLEMVEARMRSPTKDL